VAFTGNTKWGIATNDGDNAEGHLHIAFHGGGSLAGSVTKSAGGIQYNTTSDRRIKEDISPSDKGLEELMKIKVQAFSIIDDPEHTRIQGFIAQELYEIYPDAVATNGDDGVSPLATSSVPWQVDYGRLTPLIVRAIQDVYTELKALADTVAGFAQSFTTQELIFTRAHGQELCLGETCITEVELKELLQLRNQQFGSAGASSPLPQAPAPEENPVEDDGAGETSESHDESGLTEDEGESPESQGATVSSEAASETPAADVPSETAPDTSESSTPPESAPAETAAVSESAASESAPAAPVSSEASAGESSAAGEGGQS
jgi:hypothetical protein